MREIRSSGSVEGVMGNRDSYSDCLTGKMVQGSATLGKRVFITGDGARLPVFGRVPPPNLLPSNSPGVPPVVETFGRRGPALSSNPLVANCLSK